MRIAFLLAASLCLLAVASSASAAPDKPVEVSPAPPQPSDTRYWACAGNDQINQEVCLKDPLEWLCDDVLLCD